jgi:hypothetical protein
MSPRPLNEDLCASCEEDLDHEESVPCLYGFACQKCAEECTDGSLWRVLE